MEGDFYSKNKFEKLVHLFGFIIKKSEHIYFSNYIQKNSQTKEIVTYSELHCFFRISEVVALSYECRN